MHSTRTLEIPRTDNEAELTLGIIADDASLHQRLVGALDNAGIEFRAHVRTAEELAASGPEVDIAILYLDVTAATELLDAVRRGELDQLSIPQNQLDVLAQQITAEVAASEWPEDALFAAVRRAWLLYRLGRHGESIESYQHAISAAPHSAEASVNPPTDRMKICLIPKQTPSVISTYCKFINVVSDRRFSSSPQAAYDDSQKAPRTISANQRLTDE